MGVMFYIKTNKIQNISRDFIGIENDEKYFEITKERIEND